MGVVVAAAGSSVLVGAAVGVGSVGIGWPHCAQNLAPSLICAPQ